MSCGLVVLVNFSTFSCAASTHKASQGCLALNIGATGEGWNITSLKGRTGGFIVGAIFIISSLDFTLYYYTTDWVARKYD